MFSFDMYDVVFLDFDGLLVNTEHLHFRAYQEMLSNRGYNLDCDLLTYLGMAHTSGVSIKEGCYKRFPKLQKEEPNWVVLHGEKQKIYNALLDQGYVALMPGASDLLAHLQKSGKPHAVVTNSTRVQIETIKSKLPPLHSIPMWVTREDYVNAKPSPDGYLTALEAFPNAKTAVGFEDSLKGVHSLQAAKMTPILICPRNHPQCDDELLEKVTHFASLEDLL